VDQRRTRRLLLKKSIAGLIREFKDRFASDVTGSSTMNVAARRPVQGAAKPGAAATPSPLFRSGVRRAPGIYPVGPLMIWTSTCLPFSMRKWP
jgi:hypothetical protein